MICPRGPQMRHFEKKKALTLHFWGKEEAKNSEVNFFVQKTQAWCDASIAPAFSTGCASVRVVYIFGQLLYATNSPRTRY